MCSMPRRRRPSAGKQHVMATLRFSVLGDNWPSFPVTAAASLDNAIGFIQAFDE